MRKMPALVLTAITALAVAGAAPLLLRAQVGGTVRPVPGAATAEDLPHRSAREFAPFIRALISRRITNAQQLFRMRRPVLNSLDNANNVRILSRFQKLNRYELNLVGGRMFGKNAGILLFTIVNEEGPVFFKIYFYDFADQRYIDSLEISDDWSELETAATSVDMLQTPISVALNPDETPGG